MGDFEKWFKDQDFYTNMRFIHGDRLFDKDGDVYRVLPVQIAYQGWNARQGEIDELKAQLQCCRRENAVLLGRVSKALNVCDDNRLCIGKFMIEDETLGLIGEVEKALRGEHETN